MKDTKGFSVIINCFCCVTAFLLTVFLIAPNAGEVADNFLIAVKSNFTTESESVKKLYFEKKTEIENTSEETTVNGIDSMAAVLNEGEEKAENDEDTDFKTPDDIEKMRNDYLTAFASGKAKGKVTECFFTNNGATDSIGNIHIKNTASKKADFARLIKNGIKTDFGDLSEPVVLIFHTHTTESYLMADTGYFYKGYETRSTDPNRNMIRVGNEICRQLEKNGIGVIHDTNIYDETYNGAYGRSRKTVTEYLEKYPTIKIVLDVHRDAVYTSDTEHLKPVCKINGRKAAQIMIITGADGGPVASFPHWEENLTFALAVQKQVQTDFEGLMKPVYFCNRRYNMDLTDCSLLLEFGSDANTLDEAVRSASFFGISLSRLIKSVHK